MSEYTPKKGKESNVRQGAHYEKIIKFWIKEKYNNKIVLLQEQCMLPDVKHKVDFKVTLKKNKIIFVDAKYRNGVCGKGLKKGEAVRDSCFYSTIVEEHCKNNGIKDYKYILVTNGLPSQTSASHMHLEKYKKTTIHEVVVVDYDGEEEYKSSNLENLL